MNYSKICEMLFKLALSKDLPYTTIRLRFGYNATLYFPIDWKFVYLVS